jgi:hypothetical protein
MPPTCVQGDRGEAREAGPTRVYGGEWQQGWRGVGATGPYVNAKNSTRPPGAGRVGWLPGVGSVAQCAVLLDPARVIIV